MIGVELLLHNLSHSDVVFDIGSQNKAVDINSVIARPKFSKFNSLTKSVLGHVTDSINDVHLNSFNVKNRKGVNSGKVAPVGFDFLKHPIHVADTGSLRFRQEDDTKLQNGSTDYSKSAVIRSVYFPLIAILIPKWLKHVNPSNEFKKVLILVSGRGNGMDANADMSDNSTQQAGKLIQLFVNQAFPDQNIEVQLVHSDRNLFRYDDNILFVKRELLPAIDKYRDQLVSNLQEKWKENMRICLSFADGSSARISAINASLRHYKPSTMHFWQLKSFWRKLNICEDDIEYHTFEEICTEPAVALKGGGVDSDPMLQLVIKEMNKFRDEFTRIVSDPNTVHDLDTFWLRKTKKPVLAVLLVKKEGGEPKTYRGTNMEVSMPTGSLCAERNVIGSALADDITLTRRDLKIIAVYSATLHKKETHDKPTVETCIPCQSPQQQPVNTTTTVSLIADTQSIVLQSPTEVVCSPMKLQTPPTPQAATSNGGTSPRSPMVALGKRKILGITNQVEGFMFSESEDHNDNTSFTSSKSLPSSSSTTSNNTRSSSAIKKSKTVAFSHSSANLAELNGGVDGEGNGHTTTTSLVKGRMQRADSLRCAEAVVSFTIDTVEGDMNPLKPCGACNEWLKKIAEVNPTMRVVTFTDANCNGIYIEHVDG